jgi:cytochrome c5
MLKHNAVKLMGLLLISIALPAHAISDAKLESIKQRIEPVGKLCMEGDSSCATAVASAGGAAKSGEDIFNTSCMACHATGAAGAPKMGDAAAWAPRLANGIEQLYIHAIEGLNGMPPKGLCMTCSDDEIKSTVDYMLENSK